MNRKYPDLDLTPTPHPDLPDCYLIPLTNGGHAIVEEADLCRVDEHTWYWIRTKSGLRYVYRTDRKRVAMHRHLFGLGREDRVFVDHGNHDGLDNRRSANLRLATPRQNNLNKRIRPSATSAYRGVSRPKGAKMFRAKVGHTRVGEYPAEEEAAYAYQFAAALLRDPAFLNLEPIPPEKMPSPERRLEIEANALTKVKAWLSGQKLRKRGRYHNTGFHKGMSRWRSQVRQRGVIYHLGWYDAEHEAAFAYNCFVQHMGLSQLPLNRLDGEFLPAERQAEILASVIARVDAKRDNSGT